MQIAGRAYGKNKKSVTKRGYDIGFRTVIVNSRAKLEFRLNFMIVRNKEFKIFISIVRCIRMLYF